MGKPVVPFPFFELRSTPFCKRQVKMHLARKTILHIQIRNVIVLKYYYHTNGEKRIKIKFLFKEWL